MITKLTSYMGIGAAAFGLANQFSIGVYLRALPIYCLLQTQECRKTVWDLDIWVEPYRLSLKSAFELISPIRLQ